MYWAKSNPSAKKKPTPFEENPLLDHCATGMYLEYTLDEGATYRAGRRGTTRPARYVAEDENARRRQAEQRYHADDETPSEEEAPIDEEDPARLADDEHSRKRRA